ncbi:hypothetical protein P280DRAFT_457286 [Massarina eburnea CBS 473.64]|uniref:Uncharacterized protein n=1 Tax=Massarina eburnea CBS 473.64 TaxID=1395130 RepID=A0A6A6RRJ8_9PLEO|nr:hypothetical protein P280DRAFT_457286 [Massarina eburnea CBS 473.64]
MTSTHPELHLAPLGPRSESAAPTPTYIIYFMPGNPGLISYYTIFLTHLYWKLTETAHRIHVYGRSHSGFETDSTKATVQGGKAAPYGLEEQITHTEHAVERLVGSVKESEETDDVRVILMGHSVGAYMLLEVTRRLRKKFVGGEGVRVVGGVCLFPTVTHIAKSTSGRRSSPLLTLHHLAHISHLATKILTFPLPTTFLSLVIKTLLRFPAPAANVTASFIKSPYGVEQALHMARDEMIQITEDAWDAEIWGSAPPPSDLTHARPVLRFLFAEQDHWVADETRDELIRLRGRMRDGGGKEGVVEEWKPVMDIDEEEGWPHGFCIKHSVPVAERVVDYVKEIVDIEQRDEI